MQSTESEIWKDMNEFPDCYEVSNFGRVRSKDREIHYLNHGTPCIMHKKGQLLKISLDSDGYPRIDISVNGKGYGFNVHRLVAQSFIPNPTNKPTVNHIDGIKTNNHVSNLEWATYQEQSDHAIATGLRTAQTYVNAGQVTRQQRSIRVKCIETEQEFFSMIDAERDLGLWRGSVSESINHGKSVHGLHFERV